MGRHVIAGIIVTVLAVTAVGCGQGRDALTVYSGRSEALVEPIIERFRESTGIKVAVRYASTVELATTLLEEGGKSPADIFFAQNPGGLGSVEEMFASLPDSILSRVPEWGRSPEGTWVGISGRARTVVYNTERLTEADLPDDIWGLTDPKWKGRVGWAPRNGSFQTMVSAMRFTWGETRTRQWLKGVQANDPKEYANNTSQIVAVEVGEVDVGLVNHYYLHRFLAEEGESFSARNYHPRIGGPGSLIMVAGAGILASSDHREEAEQFLKFMLSRDAQQYFADETFEYPLVEGVESQRGLVPLSEIRNPTVPMRELADLEGPQAILRELRIIT